MKYRARLMEKPLLKAARQFPALMVTGPRQSGKTTLLQHVFTPGHRYVSLDDIDQRRMAQEDPALFLQNNPPPVIIDEIQYAPGLLSRVKVMVDAGRGKKGRFILTGSQVFSLMAGVSETLAGRVGLFVLLNFSISERTDIRDTISLLKLKDIIIRGGYPEPVLNRRMDFRLWYTGYIQTYLERDVRQLRQVGSLGDFQRFLQLLAAHNGQALNLSDFSRDLGVAVNTVKAWLAILEATGQVYSLRPYYANKGKRLVKSPKVYLLDTGLICHLTGIETPQQALKGPFSGQLLEALLLSELLKKHMNSGGVPRIYWWRTSNGQEVDFVIENRGKIYPVEVKLSTRAHPGMVKGLTAFCKEYRKKVGKAYLVNLGNKSITVADGIEAVPFLTFINRFPDC